MPLEAKVYLYDIQQAIERVEKIVQDKKFESYVSDETLVWAVERGLSIIGEAVTQLIKVNPSAEIASAKQIIGFRNVLIHNYARVSQAVVWKIIQEDLPILSIHSENAR
ncbi:MAG: HepT-like ribonuclease domain-containing protein [Trueperaceae bacterium]